MRDSYFAPSGVLAAKVCLSGEEKAHCTSEGKDDQSEGAKFKAQGCMPAIAASSMLTELIEGCSLDEALAITKEDLIQSLGACRGGKRNAPSLALRLCVRRSRISRVNKRWALVRR